MRFNVSTQGSDKTLNYEGDVAYKLSPKMELYSTVCTASLQRKFYESADQTMYRIRNLIKQVPHQFTAQMAVYAREKMYLRSIPLVLAVELAKVHSGDSLISNLTERIIQRPDELTEILAYYQQSNNHKGTKKLNKLSKQIQKGIAQAFNKFDEYQFGKYNRQAEITIRDALFLTHPQPKDSKQATLFKAIADSNIAIPYTWETELSRIGQEKYETEEQKKVAFKAKWEELIRSNRLGIFAVLRNLRNFLENDVSADCIHIVAGLLSNGEVIGKSKLLPFRFLSAYLELKSNPSFHTAILLQALENAVKLSTANLKGFDADTRVVIACDVSASMYDTISERSKVQRYDIGLLLGMLLREKCQACITGIFGDTWEVNNFGTGKPLESVVQLKEIEGRVGYSTNGYRVLEYLIRNKIVTNKVMMFTDCQMWDSYGGYQGQGAMKKCWAAYKEFSPYSKLYLFDLAGYGDTPVKVNENDVYLIAGWSDKVFDVLNSLEEGKKALSLIEEIAI